MATPCFFNIWRNAGRRERKRNRNVTFGLNGRVWSDSQKNPDPHPSTSTIQRSITCPARPFSSPSQCPFWSLALTELHPIYHDNSPPPSLARVGVEFLHYCSSPPFSSSLVKVSPSPLVGLAISFPAALCKTEQFWSFLAALCNRGWQSQWAQSQTCPVVSIRPTALDLPLLLTDLGCREIPAVDGWRAV